MSTQILTHGTTRITVPAGAHLTLVVTGEEDDPIDLLPHAAMLLAMRPRVPADGHEETGVDFATLDCSDEIVIERDGKVLPTDQALAELAAGVLTALRAGLESALAQAEPAGPAEDPTDKADAAQ